MKGYEVSIVKKITGARLLLKIGDDVPEKNLHFDVVEIVKDEEHLLINVKDLWDCLRNYVPAMVWEDPSDDVPDTYDEQLDLAIGITERLQEALKRLASE